MKKNPAALIDQVRKIALSLDSGLARPVIGDLIRQAHEMNAAAKKTRRRAAARRA